MPKCPHCGSSKNECLNWDERVFASCAGAATSAAMSFIHPSGSHIYGHQMSLDVCPNIEYKCTSCGKKFFKNRSTGMIY